MSFDIVGATRQLADVKKEIKRLTEQTKQARSIKTKIESDIARYLESNKQQGVIVHNTTIMNEEKIVRKPLKQIEKVERIKNILGDQATPEVIERLKNANRGNETVKKSITVTVFDPKK
jgi:predicted house-cleaning NTP pyrophosphatase (Maf/HAM1 superfamily)